MCIKANKNKADFRSFPQIVPLTVPVIVPLTVPVIGPLTVPVIAPLTVPVIVPLTSALTCVECGQFTEDFEEAIEHNVSESICQRWYTWPITLSTYETESIWYWRHTHTHTMSHSTNETKHIWCSRLSNLLHETEIIWQRRHTNKHVILIT